MEAASLTPAQRRHISLIGTRRRRAYTIAMMVVLATFTATTIVTGFNPVELLKNTDYMRAFITDELLPPNFARANNLGGALLSTIEMAFGSAFIGAIVSAFLAFFGSSTTSPSRILCKLIRGFASLLRNIPGMIWAFILVMTFGASTTVGLIALMLETIGFLTRSFIEVLDEIAGKSLDALNAVGASFFQKMFQCILPAALPGFTSWLLYAIEINIRSSTIVGSVGGGGIGLILMGFIKMFMYRTAAAVVITIIVVVLVVDAASNFMEQALLGSKPKNNRIDLLSTKQLRRRRGKIVLSNYRNNLPIYIFLACFCAASIVSLRALEVDYAKIADRIGNIGEVVVGFFFIDFSDFDACWPAFCESVYITVLTTFYSAVGGFVMAFFMAKNISPLGRASVLVSFLATAIRAVPSLIWALLAICCLGLGVKAGVVGLGIHYTAFIARSFAQCFEEVPRESIEALKCMGAGRLKIFLCAVLPSSITGIIAWIATIFERTFAASSILGMVGGGGIGRFFMLYMRTWDVGKAAVPLFLVLGFTYLLEIGVTSIKERLKVE